MRHIWKSIYVKIRGGISIKEGILSLYTTVLGQTWDMIAKEVYGSEKHADFLMENNPEKLHMFVFSSGEVLKVPELLEKAEELPPWRQP